MSVLYPAHLCMKCSLGISRKKILKRLLPYLIQRPQKNVQPLSQCYQCEPRQTLTRLKWKKPSPASLDGVREGWMGKEDFLLTRCPYHKFSSVVQLCPTLCDPMDCCMPGFPVHHQLPELAQTHVHLSWIDNAIQPSLLCHPFLLPSVFLRIRVHFNESVPLIRWPKYWSCSFSISPSTE